MTAPKIVTPRGKIVTAKNGKAYLRMSLTFRNDFKNKWQARYTNGQRYVDSEVLRLSEPYIPLRSSMLIKSGILGTDIGSGTVQWIAPYGKRQYHATRSPGSKTGPLRGPKWFERMWSVSGKKILAGSKRIIGRGEKSVDSTVAEKAAAQAARKKAKEQKTTPPTDGS